ncbi:MAG: sugar transferase [Candidatus Hydrogenedentota bacterium]
MGRILLFIIDFIFIITASFIAFYLRFNTLATEELVEWIRFLKSLPFYISFVMLYLILNNEYRRLMLGNLWDRIGTAIEGITIGVFLTICAYILGNDREFSRLLIIYQWLLSVVFILIIRIVDYNFQIRKINGCIIIKEGEPITMKNVTPVKFKNENLWEEIGKTECDYVIIPVGLVREEGFGFIERILRYIDIPILFLPQKQDCVFLSGNPVIYNERTYFLLSKETVFFKKVLKRFIDVILSVTLIIFLTPLFCIIYILIKISRYGSCIFIQERVGQYGKIFRLYKFRTMREGVAGPRVTDINDPRITAIGRILRRFSLDELPQLFNILKGDMSFVGPRPEIREIVENYDEWQRRVLSVKPGLTGLSQVSGRDDLSINEKLILDIYYVHHYKIWLDLWIMLKTFIVVLQGKGARY